MGELWCITQHAILSRCILFVSQAVVNHQFEDFDSSTWINIAFPITTTLNSPSKEANESFYREEINNGDGGHHNHSIAVVNFLLKIFNGINKWDSVYFNHIVIRGYTYEQMLAFSPGFPYLVKLFFIFVDQIFQLNDSASKLLLVQLIGYLLNATFHVLATLSLYKLTKEIEKKNGSSSSSKVSSSSDQFASVTVYLFIWNPANVFMISSYTESMFVFIQFTSLLLMEKRYYITSAIAVGIGTLVRSNGLLNIVFLVYFCLKYRLLTTKLCSDDGWKRENSSSYNLFNLELFKRVFRLLHPRELLMLFLLTFLSIIPFIGLQFYIASTVCTLPELKIHVMENNSEGGEHWCLQRFPYSYPYVQKTYWNVGFLRYYEWKQLPNFLLAAPIVCIVVAGVLNLITAKEFTSTIKTLGLLPKEEEKERSHVFHGFPTHRMFVYACHALFLTMFGILNVHVQILTRMLCSSTPFVYWSVAQIFLGGGERNKRIRRSAKIIKILLIYFISYNIIGIFLHCNFYPWS